MRLRTPELFAGIFVVLLGAPLVYMFASASASGEVRRREAPLRALLGDDYDALAHGRPTELNYLGQNRSAPDFVLNDREGHPWRLSEHRGKTLMLNFWTVTCQPCVREMPTLEHMARVLENRTDIELVTISTDRDWDSVRTVVGDRSPLRVLLDPDRAVVAGRFGTRLYPETWIIDPNGIIRLRVDGERDWSSPVTLDALELFAR
jgi:peroxiredoxin